jgi:hypothetical protein
MNGCTWAEFEAAAPEMAAAGRTLLYQHGPGLAYLATLRADGAPRVHPVCPHIAEDRLWVFVGAPSPKLRDLRRDGRYAIHTFPCVDRDDEFYVAGVATECADSGLEARVRSTVPFTTEDDDVPFTFTIERALLSKYGPRPSWPPVYTRWNAPG